MLTLIVGLVILALVFDFLNGMNDAANSIATVVATGVLPPKLAVLWAAFFNFVAAFGFEVKVAKTVGKGIVDVTVTDQWVIFAALVGAILWTFTCTQLGLPISVSHSIIGGLAGAGLAKAGFEALVFSGIARVAAFIVLSPLIGMALGFVLMVSVYWIFQSFNVHRLDRAFRVGQLVSSGAYSLGHGLNDAQKTMGIITALLFSAGYLKEFHVPVWVILTCHGVIALGTIMGGWRVVKTMGIKLTKLRPMHGFCAESAGAVSLLFVSALGIPVSTTHTIAGAIAGVGSTQRLSAVRWGLATRIVWAWVLTLPAAALVAAVTFRGVAMILG